MMNHFPGTLPTLNLNRKRSDEPYSYNGPLSSPPMVSSQLQIQRTVLSPGYDQVAERTERLLEDEPGSDVKIVPQ